MKKELWSTAITVAVCLAAIYFLGGDDRSERGPGRGGGTEATVVVVGGEGRYRCSAPRRPARGAGVEMGECRAIQQGFRPVRWGGCGSRCPETAIGAAALSARP